MLPPIGSRVLEWKLAVTGTPVLEAILSFDAMENDTMTTFPLITPERTGSEACVSEDVCTLTPKISAVTGPI